MKQALKIIGFAIAGLALFFGIKALKTSGKKEEKAVKPETTAKDESEEMRREIMREMGRKGGKKSKRKSKKTEEPKDDDEPNISP